jgi:hypothetical protein
LRFGNTPLTSTFLAETVGFEFYLRLHLSRFSLDFVEISAKSQSRNHIKALSEGRSCGQDVGKSTSLALAVPHRVHYGAERYQKVWTEKRGAGQ